MKIPKILFFALFFLITEIPILGSLGVSTVRAQEIMQLARLNQNRSFRRGVSNGSRFRSQIRASQNRSFGRKVFSSPRGSRTRQVRDLADRRFIPRNPVMPKVVRPGNAALSESHTVVNSLRTQQREVRGQFSTQDRRRFD